MFRYKNNISQRLLITKKILVSCRFPIVFISGNKSDGQEMRLWEKKKKIRNGGSTLFRTFWLSVRRSDCTRTGLNNKPETRSISCRSCLLPVPRFWIALFEYPIFPPCYCRYARVFIVSGPHSGAHLSSRLDTTCDPPFNNTIVSDESSISEDQLARDQKCRLPLKTGHPNIFLNLTKWKNIQDKLRFPFEKCGFSNNFYTRSTFILIIFIHISFFFNFIIIL